MKTVIETAINNICTELGFGEEVFFTVEHPSDLAHGDYACNVAMVLSKRVGKSPIEIAEQFLSGLDGQIEYVEKIVIAGPGFLNFYLARDFFAKEIDRINSIGKDWGKNDSWVGKRVLFEYTSPNLFKPLHIGNLVGNIIGESLSRLFEYGGAEVKRFNYPSDIGLTVAKGVWGLRKTGGNPSDILALGEAYRVGNEAYEAEAEEAEEIKSINKALYENTDPELTSLREQGIATSKASLGDILKKLGTSFDHEICESMVSEPGAKLVKAHNGDVFKESDGAIVYEGDKVGLHTRVFISSKGIPTYEAKDIGHFKLKNELEPDWDLSVIVTGSEQTEYFKVVYAVIRELFTEFKNRELEHVPTGFLTLTTGKMSSRKGNVLTGESLLEEMEVAAKEKSNNARTGNLEELAEEVAVAALKYQILKHGIGSNIIFDKEKALSFEGDSGPYLQYTNARINSALEKAKQNEITGSIKDLPAEIYRIEKLVYQFAEVVEEALAERAPHKVATFLTQLASEFNSFYAQEKIADKEDQSAPYKVALAKAVSLTLINGLWVLGIKAPERM
ncbi:arginine--tRNA ligase [Candidatus Kaiserbacteria bacterium]|nr:arginine--tRNA ligase [Candidatus Kaiserbacteria bacterium]